jgi:hypothetical protein
VAGSSDVEKPDINAFAGKYQPLVVPYLSDSNYTGYSTKAWYLFGNPDDVPAFVIAYLSGQERPTIESADTDFDTLGLQWRAYADFGAAQAEVKGAVKSKGEA